MTETLLALRVGGAASAFVAAGIAGLAGVGAMSGCHAGSDSSADGAPRGSLGSTIVLGGDGGAAAQVVAALRDAGPNEIGLDEAVVQKALNPSGLPAYSGPTGSIEGTVWITGAPSPARPSLPTSKCPEAPALYAKLFREGPANDKGARPLADAIVGVNDPPGPSSTYLPVSSGSATATIEGCTLGTRTVAMTFGQRLDVVNHGTRLVGPKLTPSGVVALMLAPPKGDPVHLYPTKPGHYLLGDALATDAIDADLFVFLFPLHVVTPETGHFRIDGIPAGRRRVFAHLPAIDSGATRDVDIRGGETTSLDLTIKYDPSKPAPALTAPGPTTNPVR
jgi:hypothetical protein